MTGANQEQRLAFRIAEILRQGLDLGDATQGFMESTFGAATREILAALTADPETSESHALLELIFFPDQACQIRLEETLISMPAAEPKEVARYLESMIDRVPVRLSGEPETIDIPFTADQAELFVARLRIGNNPDPDIEAAIRENVAPEKINPVLVRLRNADFRRSPHISRFFCRFFSKMDSRQEWFLPYVDFLMGFAETLHQTIDIFKALMKRKRQCLEAIEKAQAYEKQLKKYTMEVMILKGDRNPCINRDECQATVAMINDICFTLYGRTDYQDAGGQQVDLGRYRPDKDLETVIRLLS